MDTTNFKMSLHENSIADLKDLIQACENEIKRKKLNISMNHPKPDIMIKQ